MNSQKTQGFFLLLIFVWLGTFFLNDGFAGEYNSRNLIRYCTMFGIIGIGVMFVIVTGGIDLSIGSTIGLIGASLVLLLRLNPVETLKPLAENEKTKVVWFFWILVVLMTTCSSAWLIMAFFKKNRTTKKLLFPAIFLSLGILSYLGFAYANSAADNAARIPWIVFLLFSISLHIGLLHGVLITRFQLQPFVVTLGGLLCYRGLIRWLTSDTTQGLGSTFDESLRMVARGQICTVSTMMLIVGTGAAVYFGQQLLTNKARGPKARHQAIVGTSIALILAIIGSSRFWQGFTRENFNILFDTHILGVIPLKFSTWTTVVTEASAARPRMIMESCWIPMGILLLVCLGCLVTSAFKSRTQKTLKELLYLPIDFFWLSGSRQTNAIQFSLVSIGGLAITVTALRYAFLLANGEWETNLTQNQAWWANMISVFTALALVMASVSRLGRCVSLHGNATSKLLFPIAGALAILFILGKTELSTTIVQTPFFISGILALLAIVVFDKTVFGRYLLAIGNNENAARFSGIDTQEVKIAAYVICSGIVGISAIIFMLDFNSVAPTGFGSFYELYAIAAVVLGGCSLRGGEANVIGVLLGASIMRVLANAPDMIDFPKTLEYTILGLVILIGVIVDDRIRKQSAAKAMEANPAD
jgi:ribose/xylose/arabinose/galactoside ABC-type transport system permease subunit